MPNPRLRHAARLTPVVWLTALALLGIIAAACSGEPAPTATPIATPTPTRAPTPEPEAPGLATHLYALESESIELEGFDGSGGAIESVGDDLLVATPKGRLALVAPDGTVEYLEGNVPMNYAALQSSAMSGSPDFDPYPFKVADILLQEIEDGYTLFVTHHHFGAECVRFRLSATTLIRDGQQWSVGPNWRTVFDAEPCSERTSGWYNSGGKMLTDGVEHLLVTIGNQAYGQRPIPDDLHIGKFVRVAIATGEAEVLATGLRTARGLARDADGNLWATDNGPRGGDELNLLRESADYGYPFASYGIGHGEGHGGESMRLVKDEDTGRHDGFERPAFAWVPNLGISALAVNDAQHFPLWQDDLLVASDQAVSLFRIRRHGTQIQYVEQIAVGYPIRDITLLPDGRIALLQDDNKDDNWVHLLSRSDRYCTEDVRERRDVYAINCAAIAPPPTATPDAPAAANPDAYTTTGQQLFIQQCSACHTLTDAQHRDGPHLVGIIARTPGAADGYDYSAALRGLETPWTADDIIRYLTSPEQFAPGTAKSASGTTEAEARAIVIYMHSIQ